MCWFIFNIPGSPADKAGIRMGHILVSVNSVNVLESSHEEIIRLIQQCKYQLFIIHFLLLRFTWFVYLNMFQINLPLTYWQFIFIRGSYIHYFRKNCLHLTISTSVPFLIWCHNVCTLIFLKVWLSFDLVSDFSVSTIISPSKIS